MSQSLGPPRRSRFRFLYQFSLRTLLLATAAIAVFCNWYFEPKYREEPLAGKELRLRRQMKMVARPPEDAPPSAVPTPNPAKAPWEYVNHGNWSLLDADEFTLTRGRFVESQAAGTWTAWYPTGGKAAEGKMRQGVKVGRWRTWYEDGTLASEIDFTPQPLTREQLVVESNAYYCQIGCVQVPRHEPASIQVAASHVSFRDGRSRAWYPNGRLQYEGEYKLGLQHGLWTFYDERGNALETGPFRAGKRHGQWTFSGSRPPSGVHYIDGHTQAKLNEFLDRLKPLLASENRRQRYAALIDLAAIGEGAVPLLIQRLSRGDAHEQAAIVGMLPRMPSGVHLVLPQVRELVASKDERLAHEARLTLFQLDSEAREKLFEPLLRDAVEAPTLGQCLEELVALYRGDETYRERVFGTLMSLPTTRDDSDASRLAEEVAHLGGDVTPFVVAACNHNEWRVRLQAVHTIERLKPRWYSPVTRFALDEAAYRELLSKLRRDTSPDVRQVAEALADPPVFFGGPSGNWGTGTGFTGGSSF